MGCGQRLQAVQAASLAAAAGAEAGRTPQYTNIIWGYMGFAGFSIFFVLTGILGVQLIQLYRIPIDLFSFLFLLYNFAVRPGPGACWPALPGWPAGLQGGSSHWSAACLQGVPCTQTVGVLALFFMRAPLLMKQVPARPGRTPCPVAQCRPARCSLPGKGLPRPPLQPSRPVLRGCAAAGRPPASCRAT